MPLFDLRCNECQKEFTKMTSYSKLAESKCPHCNSENHERVYKANIKGPIKSGSGSGGFTPTSSGFT
ncbi:MAG TPA: zinc ribbon domain-containing protein [Pseudogracilibacillus sp.]|nr:zinc ribbon domain-containing protein [Pseudogracilibacillus sp.]